MSVKNETTLNRLLLGDCRELLPLLEECSVDLLLSDIPYGISLDDWDVLHTNTNSALLGQSPAQIGKSGFKRRGKPINGWSSKDRERGREYERWCSAWVSMLAPAMKPGSSLLVFGARRTIHHVINAFEAQGFLLKDLLSWKKPTAHHRAQRVSKVLERRGKPREAEQWEGWRLGNLAPIWEPIAWFTKPYKIGGTLTDNLLTHGVGALYTEAFREEGMSPTNQLECSFEKGEERVHEAQKPLALIRLLIRLCTRPGQVVLDPFMGSGTTAVAATQTGRSFLGYERHPAYHAAALKRLASLDPLPLEPR